MRSVFGLLSISGALAQTPADAPGVATPGVATPAVATDSTVAVEEVVEVPTIPEALLRERLPSLQKTIPLTYNKTVHGFIDYFTFRKPSYTQRMLERQTLFFPLYERMLAKYDLPDELKYLSMVESALNPRAISHAGAGGLWQFMPGTGRDMRLYQDEYVDERMEPVKSTEAACKFLKSLYNMFGDWELALAAYNSGPGTVKRAMRRSGGDTFWTIYNYLPKETRSYVPLFIAHTYMMHFANDHGIFAENPVYQMPFDTINVNSYFCLQTFSRLTGIKLEDIQALNPHIVSTVLPEYTRNFMLRVPSYGFDEFRANRVAVLDSACRMPVAMAHVLLADAETVQYGTSLLANRDERWLPETLDEETGPVVTIYTPTAGAKAGRATEASARIAAEAAAAANSDLSDDLETVVLRKPKKQTYVVRRGDNLLRVADRYGVEVYDLKKWNNLRSNTLRAGQKLVILKEIAETRNEQLAEQGTAKGVKKTETALKTKKIKPRYHTVQQGDTLWNIAQRYGGMPIERLKKLNNIRGNTLKPGQKLIVG